MCSLKSEKMDATPSGLVAYTGNVSQCCAYLHISSV